MADYAVCAVVILEEDDENEQKRDHMGQTALLMATILQTIAVEEKSRIRGYVEEVVPHYTEEDFRRMFRMKPATFYSLVDYIKDFPEVLPAGPGRRDPISVEKQPLITLWYVGGKDSISRIADRFGVSESTVVACRDKVMKVILKLRNRLIRWPTQQKLQNEEQEFARRNGFPGIVGAIDGTHIEIKAPKNNPQSYVNRKHFHSYSYSVSVCTTDCLAMFLLGTQVAYTTHGYCRTLAYGIRV